MDKKFSGSGVPTLKLRFSIYIGTRLTTVSYLFPSPNLPGSTSIINKMFKKNLNRKLQNEYMQKIRIYFFPQRTIYGIDIVIFDFAGAK